MPFIKTGIASHNPIMTRIPGNTQYQTLHQITGQHLWSDLPRNYISKIEGFGMPVLV